MVTAAEEQGILNFGLSLFGKNKVSYKESLEDFKANYGTHPAVVATLWRLLQRVGYRSLQKKHLFWALYFLKTYSSERVRCSTFKCCRETQRNKIWPIIEAIASLHRHVVSLCCSFKIRWSARTNDSVLCNSQ